MSTVSQRLFTAEEFCNFPDPPDEEKLREYFAIGVRLVWVVAPEDRTIALYRNPDEGRLLHENAVLSGEDVLPGYSCRVREFFP